MAASGVRQTTMFRPSCDPSGISPFAGFQDAASDPNSGIIGESIFVSGGNPVCYFFSMLKRSLHARPFQHASKFVMPAKWYASLVVAALLLGAPWPARAQTQGPMTPPPPEFKVKRIPSVPQAGPLPMPKQVLIQKFAANEDAAEELYKRYSFTQSILIEELSNPGGKFTVSGEEYTRPDGSRYWRVTQPLKSDLKFTSFTLADVHKILDQPLFFLTTNEIGNYNFLYAGKVKLDELHTYVFQVRPKRLSRKRLFFEGVIYVDVHDLAIVESYGKFVSEIAAENGTGLPFTMFDIYRENFRGKYWLPTYVSSDDYLSEPDGSDLHIRLVVHSTDFKLNSAPAAAPAASSAPSSLPAPVSKARPPQILNRPVSSK